MKIALCEDEKIYIERIKNILSSYRTPDGSKIFLDVYENALDLIEAMKKVEYDTLLLDIIMSGLTGIEAARDIREINRDIPIIFLTGSPEFAVESYRVRAFNYLLKPVVADELYQSLNEIYVLRQSYKKDGLTVTLSKKGGTVIIPFEQIVFLEINNRTLSFHLLDGSCKEVNGKISDLEALLSSRENFLKVHRSYIINMDNMKSYDRKSFIAMTGENIPIARTIIKEVQKSYMEYLHAMIRENV